MMPVNGRHRYQGTGNRSRCPDRNCLVITLLVPPLDTASALFSWNRDVTLRFFWTLNRQVSGRFHQSPDAAERYESVQFDKMSRSSATTIYTIPITECTPIAGGNAVRDYYLVNRKSPT